MLLIERPENKKFTIWGDELWQILLNAEKQGGNKSMAWNTNLIVQEVIRRHDK
jgi:hypothetical protein